MQRNSQIDVARGIGILLVVFGHCFYSLSVPLNKFVLSFHMPLFFFLSGLTVRPEIKRGGASLEGKYELFYCHN